MFEDRKTLKRLVKKYLAYFFFILFGFIKEEILIFLHQGLTLKILRRP